MINDPAFGDKITQENQWPFCKDVWNKRFEKSIELYKRQFIIFDSDMKDNYVNNAEELIIANETQKNKIQFLERQRIKRDHYLEDLKENLLLNKETMRTLNSEGPNLTAIEQLISQTDQLSLKLKEYYEEYQAINAVLLMEKQMRLEERSFYSERMAEFENKMIDLRKYLHDKEDSFSSVVTRLRRYEDLGESTMDDKLSNFKKQIGERHINEFIAEILKEKQFYKTEFQKIAKICISLEGFKIALFEQYPGSEELLSQYQNENKDKVEDLLSSIYRAHSIVQESEKEGKEKKKNKVEPNKQLIRLLKKEKLSKELHEEALNEAIEKNEELISIKNIYEKSLEQLQRKCKLLYAENAIFAVRLAEYDNHYMRYATHNKRYYEEGEIAGLRIITEDRLKEYGKIVQQHFESDKGLYRRLVEKMKLQVEKWGQFICDSSQVKKQLDKKKLLRKSCSVPHLLVGCQLDQLAQDDQMIIEQY